MIFVILSIFLVGGTMSLLMAHAVSTNTDVAAVACRGVNQLSHTILVIVQSRAAAIGKKGSAGYAYYQAHPLELADVKKQFTAELVRLHELHCP